jgi:hypothetical protein
MSHYLAEPGQETKFANSKTYTFKIIAQFFQERVSRETNETRCKCKTKERTLSCTYEALH